MWRQSRGFIHTGPACGSDDDLRGEICPWCLADGAVHKKFDAEFDDPRSGIGGQGQWEAASPEVIEESEQSIS